MKRIRAVYDIVLEGEMIINMSLVDLIDVTDTWEEEEDEDDDD